MAGAFAVSKLPKHAETMDEREARAGIPRAKQMKQNPESRIQNSEVTGQRSKSQRRVLTTDSWLLTPGCCAAFTLIELLTVIAIIAVLAALTVGLFNYATIRST